MLTHSDTQWKRSLASAIRELPVLLRELGLERQETRDEGQEPEGTGNSTSLALEHLPLDTSLLSTPQPNSFPLLVPRSYLARMRPGDPQDPLLRQVLPIAAELETVAGFVTDAVDDDAARKAPGLLQKYQGRVLLIATGSCAVNCRYCFRRHYPYNEEPKRLDDWAPALAAIESDPSIHEVILSGGDPLMLPDERLAQLIERLESIEHLTRLRIHSRLPIVLPDRVNAELLEQLRNTRLQPVMVVHANHPHEIAGDCEEALRTLVRSGVPTLNQAVLLRGVNDSVEALAGLCERLIDVGVMPYYLHLLDRVAGTAHFEVPAEAAQELIAQLRTRLPGYAVPQLVREIAGEPSKTPV